MSKKHRGGLTRSERKLEIAKLEADSARKKAERAQEHYEALRKTVKCCHPVQYYHSGPFVAACSLCGWSNA